MAKRNYKVYTQVGTSRNILERLLAGLDSGAGPKCNRESGLPHVVTRLRYGPLPNVTSANNNPIRMKGLADSIVRLGSRLVKLDFIVCERLSAPLILGCDFMDRFAEAIYPRTKTVEMDEGSTIPITPKTDLATTRCFTGNLSRRKATSWKRIPENLRRHCDRSSAGSADVDLCGKQTPWTCGGSTS